MKLTCGSEIIELKPSKIVAVARNYKAHAEEMGAVLPSEPKIFLKPPSALLPDKGQVILPKASARVDYEVELAVIVGSMAKNVTSESVSKLLLGYAVLVDITARDVQSAAKKQGMPWTVAKGYDTFAPLGPTIVPAQNLDPSNLDIWLKLNGEIKQQGNTNLMVFSVTELVSFISRIMTLEPMDVIATGTPSGVGPLEDGDVVEAGIEGIGTLTFTAVREH
ncbi:MAG: fumarylacetoacetate hydrolase family protein [candidate division WOR-3 bacterium]|nr:MAG: fumarylacetoacetate hydrolase family protein [candidate division WOR-3 bacterium]